MQNFGSFRPLGAILGAPSHTKLDFAIPLYYDKTIITEKRSFLLWISSHLLAYYSSSAPISTAFSCGSVHNSPVHQSSSAPISTAFACGSVHISQLIILLSPISNSLSLWIDLLLHLSHLSKNSLSLWIDLLFHFSHLSMNSLSLRLEIYSTSPECHHFTISP